MRVKASAILTLLVLVFSAMQGPAAQADEAKALATAAGKLLVTGFHGKTPSSKGVKAIGADIANGRIGGVLLFRRNISSPKQLSRLTRWLQAQSPDGDLLIFVDQEGGKVARLKARNGWKNWPSAQWVAGQGLKKADQVYGDMADALAKAGVNVNFGPVVDVAIEPRNPVVAQLRRGYSDDPEVVAAFAERFIEAHRAAGLRTCLKHFPGHGSSRGDTHKQVVSLKGLWRPDIELSPYVRLIVRRKPAAHCVMTSHLLVPELGGPQGEIVTFAPKAIELLRETIGFQGVIITDDLYMDGVRLRAKFAEASVRALAAGHDMVLVADRWIDGASSGRQFRRAVADALRRGDLEPESVRASLQRRAQWRP